MRITAIVLDGFHQGHLVQMEYVPTLRLLKPSVVRVDYCCPKYGQWPESDANIVEYKECFRSVDRRVVLYSEKGSGEEIIANPSLFAHVFSPKAWTPKTTLYLGFHEEPMRRSDEDV